MSLESELCLPIGLAVSGANGEMVKFPLFGKLCKFITRELRSIVRHYLIRCAISSKVALEFSYYGTGFGIFEFVNFEKIA